MTAASRHDISALRPAFWSTGWFWASLMAISTLPFLVSPVPMMPDYFSHMARYHVMNHGAASPYLSRTFAFEWSLIGNLGVDLVMVPLGRLLPTELAARIAAGMIPALTIAGIYAISRAVRGRIEASALLALPFVYAFSFLYGFVNYHLALALALLVFALWVRCERLALVWRYLLFAPLAFAVWVCHVAGWGALAVMVGVWELASALRRGERLLVGIRDTVVRALPMALPLVFILAWRASSAGMSNLASYDLRLKAVWPLVMLRSENKLFDVASVLLVAGVTIWLLLSRRSGKDVRLLAVSAALAAAYLVMPTMLFDSFYADARLLPLVAIVLLLSLSLKDRRAQTVVAMLALALFGVRLAAVAVGWHQRGQAAAMDLRALEQVPKGSRIAALAVPTYCGTWQMRGFEHLPSMAIVRREAFVDSEWDTLGAQLMHPVYNKGRGYNDTSAVMLGGGRGNCPGNTVAQSLAGLPRDRFDYVWIFDQPPQQLPWLRLTYSGADGRLYRIVRAVN